MSLAGRIEEDGPSYELAADLARTLGSFDDRAFTSLDHVEELRRRLLPGWYISIDQHQNSYSAFIERRLYSPQETCRIDPIGDGEAPTETLARLAAITRAFTKALLTPPSPPTYLDDPQGG